VEYVKEIVIQIMTVHPVYNVFKEVFHQNSYQVVKQGVQGIAPLLIIAMAAMAMTHGSQQEVESLIS